MATTMSAEERLDFWRLVAGQFLIYSGFFAFFQFPLFIKSMGGDEGTIGLIMGISSLAAALMMPIQGPLMERTALKPLVTGGNLLLIVTTLFCLSLTEPGLMMALLILTRGLAFSVSQNSSSTFLARIIPKAERARRLGIVFAGSTAATAFGPALGEAAIHFWGFPALFWGSSGLLLFGTLLMSTVSPPVEMEKNPEPFRMFSSYFGFFQELAKPRLRFLFLTLLAMACAIGGLFNFTATYTSGMGLSSGVFFVAFSGLNMTARIGAGGLSDKLGRPAVVLPSIIMFSVGLAVYSFMGGLWTLIGAAMLTGFGFSLINPTISAQMLDQTPTKLHGTSMVAFHFAYSTGMMIAVPVLGLVASDYGYRIMWWGLVGMVLLGGLLYLIGETKGPGITDAEPA